MRRKTTLSPELKNAIAKLDPQQKDKLLFRLLPYQPDLVEKLTFQLLEPADNKNLRRDELKENIETALEKYKTYYYSPGYLLLLLRDISGDINRHRKTTGDKYGEIELNLLMLNKSLQLFGKKINEVPPGRSRTFDNYVVKRALKLIDLLGKMHEDLALDFAPAMKELAWQIRGQVNMSAVAEDLGLDIGLLEEGFLPE